MQWNKNVWSLFLHILPDFSINRNENVASTLSIPFLTVDFSKQNCVSVKLQTFLRRHNVIYTHAMFSQMKASVKLSVTAATLSNVTSCMQIRAQIRLFQVKAMFKQHVNHMIWIWILRLQTASRNKFPCKNNSFPPSQHWFYASLSQNPLTWKETIWTWPKQKHCLHKHHNIDWLQSLKQFFINVSYHIIEASLTLMALFKTEPSELDWLQAYDMKHWWKIVLRTGASLIIIMKQIIF